MNWPAWNYTALAQGAKMVQAALVLSMLPVLVDPVTQGYWFTMVSLNALLAFADMGLSTIAVQFAARASVNDSKENELQAIYWVLIRQISVVGLIAVPVTFVIGLWLLSDGELAINQWLPQWVALCVISGISLPVAVHLAYMEGKLGVQVIQPIRFQMTAVAACSSALFLVVGCSLWALPMGVLASLTALILNRNLPGFQPPEASTNRAGQLVAEVRSEVRPLMFRYAGSWLGGYLMFQSFTPIAFYFFGAEVAGEFGITQALFAAVFSLSVVWCTFQLPEFTKAATAKNLRQMDNLFKISIVGALSTYLLIGTSLIIALELTIVPALIADRFSLGLPLYMLGICWFAQVIVHTLAVYVRAFVVEPFVVPTLIAAFFVVLVTGIIAEFGHIDLFYLGFVSMYLVFIPYSYVLYRRSRRLLHA